MTIDREKVLTVLLAKREEVERLYGIRIVGIVGSVARGDATEKSDIDVIADITGSPSLFKLSRAERDLKDAIGVGLPVELVLRKGMRPDSRAYMERDLISLE